MRPETFGTALGLGAAGAIGVGDFLGGFATKTRDAFRVVLTAHTAGLVGIALVVAAQRLPPPSFMGVAVSLAAGIVSVAATVAFYEALSRGKMGAASTLSALLSALVPVLFSWILAAPSATRLGGVALALVAIALLTREKGKADHRTMALAGASGLGFGTFFVLLTRVGNEHGAWPVMLTRLSSVAALALVVLTRRRASGRAGVSRIAIAAGLCDTAANLVFLVAIGYATLDLVAVLAAMYPVVTLGLAMVVLRERPNVWQGAGIGLALLAVLLLQFG